MLLLLKNILLNIVSNLFLILFLIVFPVYGEDSLTVPLVRIIDGDTFQTIFTLPSPLNNIKIRIRDIDVPESNYLAKCEEEKEKGRKATEYLKYILIDSQFVTLTQITWDKYGGRVTATVHYNGINIGQEMINSGHAVFYDGGKKPKWCEK